MVGMDFTSLRIKSIYDSPTHQIFEGLSTNFYELKNKSFSDSEEKFARLLGKLILRQGSFSELDSFSLPSDFKDEFRDKIVSSVESNDLAQKIPSTKVFVSLVESLIQLVSPLSFINDKAFFCEFVLQNALGIKQLSFFYLDRDLEELMVNGVDSVFVFHKKFGMCKVNVSIDEKALQIITSRIAFTAGREFNESHPVLDARLPDGSRVNSVMGEICPNGISLTIRKFSPTPLTILDLIESNVLSSEVASFLWLMADGFGSFQKNILVVGGTSSGKTTLLNILSNFSRLHERVVSIEDTLEISLLGRENWVALEARDSSPETSMNSLLKNSLRMRPDRIIVGEVRGQEALTMFSAMDSGHKGCLGTIHANSARESVTKLSEKPFSVPTVMIPLVDLIVVIQRFYSKEFGIKRRITEIAEVSRMDSRVLLSNLYEYDSALDRIKRTNIPSHLFEVLSSQLSLSKNDLKKEMEIRKMILEWMIEKDLRKPLDVLEVIQTYYYNPKKVVEMIQSKN